jgi:heme/copper-type cytochrome/quinol oxidase subunit 3
VLALVLASSSVPLQLGLVAARSGRARRAVAAIVLALAVQIGYLAAQLVLYAHDVDRVRPQSTSYGSIYVTMLGIHAAHVAVGILLDLWLALRLTQGLTRYRVVGLQSTTLYWHVVNALVLLVVLVQLSPLL